MFRHSTVHTRPSAIQSFNFLKELTFYKRKGWSVQYLGSLLISLGSGTYEEVRKKRYRQKKMSVRF